MNKPKKNMQFRPQAKKIKNVFVLTVRTSGVPIESTCDGKQMEQRKKTPKAKTTKKTPKTKKAKSPKRKVSPKKKRSTKK